MKELALLKKLKKINVYLSGMELRLFVLIALLSLMLAITSIASVYYSATDNSQASVTQIDGFQTFSIINNGQGNITVDRNEVDIQAFANSSPKTLLFSSTNDFAWNFSGTAISAIGNSIPITVSIEWGPSRFFVFAGRISGWRYDYANDSIWASKEGMPLNGSLALGSIYNFEVDCREIQEDKVVNFKVRNQTWNAELTTQIPAPTNTAPGYVVVALQAGAGNESEASATYSHSVFASYNVEKLHGLSVITTFALDSASAMFTSLTIILFYKKLNSGPHFKLLQSRIVSPLNKSNLTALGKNLKKQTARMQTCFKKNKVAFLTLLAFVAIRLVFASASVYHFFDMFTFRVWDSILRKDGLPAIYPISDLLPPLINRPGYPYPPIIAYIILFMSHVSGVQTANQGFFVFLMKIPPILADLALGWVIFAAVKAWKGYKIGLIAFVFSLLNLVDSSVWGQFDSVAALFMVVSVLLVMKNRIEAGWLFAGLALGTKQTVLPYLPGLLVLTFKQKRWSGVFSAIAAFTVMFLLVWSPFLLNGYSLDFAVLQSGLGLWMKGGALNVEAAEMTKTTIHAFNVWPIITRVSTGVPLLMGLDGVNDVLPKQLFLMNYYQIGLLLFAIFYVAILLSFRRTSDQTGLPIKFSLLMLAFYLFPTRIHERYMLFSLVFLPLAFGSDLKLTLGSYLTLLTTFSISLGYSLSSQSVLWVAQNHNGLLPNAMIELAFLSLIFANVLIFVLLLYHVLRVKGV